MPTYRGPEMYDDDSPQAKLTLYITLALALILTLTRALTRAQT